MDNSPYATPLDIAIKALKNLKPGESYTYYSGFLESERLNDPLGEHSRLADFAYSLMQEGKLTLTQRRLSPPRNRFGRTDWQDGKGAGFDYIAIGIEPKKRKPSFTFAQIARSERY